MSAQEAINVYTDWTETFGSYVYPRSYESFAEYCLSASHIDILATTIGKYKWMKAHKVLFIGGRSCGFCVLYISQNNREDCEGCPIRRWTDKYCVNLPMSNHDTMLKAAERLLEHWLTGSELDLEDLGIEEVQDVL